LEDREIVEYQNHWIWNIKTKMCWFSNAWCENLGFERSELIQHEDTWKSLVHVDCMPGVWEKLQPVISGGKDRYECIYRLRNKSDKYIWHLDTGKVLKRDASGVATLMEGCDVPIAC
jgi:hypothetical protein